jgi:hypothetical protein
MAKNENLIKYRDELQAEKQAILAKVEPVREEFEKLTQNPRINELRKIIIEHKPRLLELDNELAALARALGPVKSIKVEPGIYK